MSTELHAEVVAVSLDAAHGIAKSRAETIALVEGLGVCGDAHAGVTVQHRSRVRRDPTKPNLRQVHLIHAELLDELRDAGFEVQPGQMGENVTTRGIDLLGLPPGTLLRLGADAVVEVQGLRNPCRQLDEIEPGLMAATLGRDDEGEVVRKTGVMTTVVTGGEVRAGDRIEAKLPAEPHARLEVV